MRLPRTIKIYGDQKFRDKNCSLESTEQKDFFGRLKEHRPQYYAVALHPKNEGMRTPQQAQRDREQGALNTGACDILIPAKIPFLCEMKRKDHTKSQLPDDEVAYLEAAELLGCFTCISLGADAAWQALLDWENKYLIK